MTRRRFWNVLLVRVSVWNESNDPMKIQRKIHPLSSLPWLVEAVIPGMEDIALFKLCLLEMVGVSP